jgi:hypothetical protein
MPILLKYFWELLIYFPLDWGNTFTLLDEALQDYNDVFVENNLLGLCHEDVKRF